jgi:repressor LexA
MEILGVNSKSVVHRFFQQMTEQGYVAKKQGQYLPQDKLVSFPLFESVQAGFPTAVNDEIPHSISIESYLISHPDHTILLKVKGDRMIDAGLYEGDIVIVEKGTTANVGEMVIALVDQEYTVKFLDKDTKGYFLRAANPAYPDIRPSEELKIFGVVVGSFRKYRL